MEKLQRNSDKEIYLLIEKDKIKEVLMRYATAIDTKDWPLLKTCFLPDGAVDYGPDLGKLTGSDAIVNLVRGVIENLTVTQHLTGNYRIEIEGDTARCISYLHAQHYLAGAKSGETFIVGGTYHDTIVNTDDGWKIKHRWLETTWTTGNSQIMEEAAS